MPHLGKMKKTKKQHVVESAMQQARVSNVNVNKQQQQQTTRSSEHVAGARRIKLETDRASQILSERQQRVGLMIFVAFLVLELLPYYYLFRQCHYQLCTLHQRVVLAIMVKSMTSNHD
jgi:hypothetical protein